MNAPLTPADQPEKSSSTSNQSSAVEYNQLDVLMQAPVALVVFSGPRYIIELANDLFLPIAGKSREELINKPAFEAMPLAASQGFIEILDGVRSSGVPFHLNEHKTLIERSGTVHASYLNIVYQPIRDQQGTVEKVLIMITDVSEQVAAREQLSRNVELVNDMSNAMPQVVWKAEPDGRVTYYNDKVKELQGAVQQEDGTWTWINVLHPEDEALTIERWTTAVKEGSIYEIEHRIKMKDGSFRWHLSRGIPKKDASGKVMQWYGTSTDIHERKLIEENLSYQKKLLETITDNTDMALFMMDDQQVCIYMNEAAEQMTGFTLEELKGKQLHYFIHHTHPDGRHYPLEECPIDQALPSHRRTKGEEVFVHRDGSFYRVAFTASPIIIDGKPTGTVIEVRNTTLEKAKERAMRENEEHLRLATSSANMGTWSYDFQSGKVLASEALKELYGLSVDQNFEYQTYLNAVVDEDQDLIMQFNKKVIQEGKTDFTSEYRIRRISDGEIRWLRARGKILLDESGQPNRFAGVIIDVTSEKNAEEVLRYRQALLEAQNETIPDGMLIVDTKGKILTYNQKYVSIWKMPKEVTDQKNDHASLQHAMSMVADPQSFIERVNYFHQGTEEAPREEIPLKDGRILERYGKPVIGEDKRFYGWAWYFRDITEQKKAEEALRQSEEQFREISDFMPQMVWSTDAQGYHDFYNKRWYEFTGKNYEQTKGEGWSGILHPEDMDRTFKVWEHSLRTGDLYEVEYRMKRADGQFRWQLARAMPLRNEEGRIIRWFGTCTDIHDQKTIEERLETLVADRTRELQRSNEDLQQFAHVASHDLKEPVRKMITFESRLSYEFGHLLPDRAKTYLSKLEHAANRMYAMIDGVLLYSSVNDSVEKHEKINLNKTFADIQSDLEVLIEEKNATITTEPLPEVEGYPTLLYQLFYNLLNNSLKFSKEGVPPVIRISAEIIPTDQGKEDSSEKGKHFARICIEDNGIGFEPNEAGKIFKTFTRLNPKDKFEGTGLGLALCHKIVDRHQGTIRAEGRSNEGARFIITLPLEQ